MLARLREAADAVRQLDDLEGRMRRAATQAIVREAYYQTVGEQEDERRRPAAFAEAWKSHLAALLSRDTITISRRSPITAACRDTDLAWQLYTAASRARADAIEHATAMLERTPWDEGRLTSFPGD